MLRFLLYCGKEQAGPACGRRYFHATLTFEVDLTDSLVH